MAARTKKADYQEELRKIDEEMAALEKKRKGILARKRDSDAQVLTEFLRTHGISAEDAVEMLTPVAAAAIEQAKQV